MATKILWFWKCLHMWSVTASPLLPGMGYTKTSAYSLKEIVEPFFLESLGEETGVFTPPSPAAKSSQDFGLCSGL
jgi:hypothetical protein